MWAFLYFTTTSSNRRCQIFGAHTKWFPSFNDILHRTPLIFNQEGTNLRLFRSALPQSRPCVKCILIQQWCFFFHIKSAQLLFQHVNHLLTGIFQNALGAQNSLIFMSNLLQRFRKKKVVIGSLWVWSEEKKPLGVGTGSIDLQSTSTNPGGSLPLWPVDHAQPKKRHKHGFIHFA